MGYFSSLGTKLICNDSEEGFTGDWLINFNDILKVIDWLILMTFQPIYGYFMARG